MADDSSGLLVFFPTAGFGMRHLDPPRCRKCVGCRIRYGLIVCTSRYLHYDEMKSTEADFTRPESGTLTQTSPSLLIVV